MLHLVSESGDLFWTVGASQTGRTAFPVKADHEVAATYSLGPEGRFKFEQVPREMAMTLTEPSFTNGRVYAMHGGISQGRPTGGSGTV